MNPRVLVVRFRAIGDCVMAAYPVTALRNAMPDAHIVWAVEPSCTAVIDRGMLADRVVHFPRQKWKKQGEIRTIPDQLRHYLRLRKFKFDLGIDFQGHSKTALALRISGAKQRMSVRATDALARSLNPVAAIDPGIVHTVERHMAALNTLGHYPCPEFPLMPQRLPIPAGLPEKPFVSLMTGASSKNKLYALAQWEEVARSLVARGVPVVFVGGPSDPHPTVQGATDLVGQLRLRESMTVLRASAVHAAPDTGTGHIAAAYGVSVVSLFGKRGHGPAEFRPYSPRVTVLQSSGHVDEIAPNLISEAIFDTFSRNLL